MKTVVALLAVACTVVQAVPRPEDASQMKGQSGTTNSSTTPAPSASSMSPESSNSMSTPNIADQGKQPAQQMPSPQSSPTPSMPQDPMNNSQGVPTGMGSVMGQESMGSVSQSGEPPQPQPQNIYQTGK